jgi:hypothetical protein
VTTRAHSSDSASIERTRSSWRRRFDRVVNNAVLFCAVWTLSVGFNWILKWLLSSSLEQTASRNEVAGHAVLGVILLITGLAAGALAVKRSGDLEGSGMRQKHPRRVDQQGVDS